MFLHVFLDVTSRGTEVVTDQTVVMFVSLLHQLLDLRLHLCLGMNHHRLLALNSQSYWFLLENLTLTTLVLKDFNLRVFWVIYLSL